MGAILALTTIGLWFFSARAQTISPRWPGGQRFVYAFETRATGIDSSGRLFNARGSEIAYRLDVMGRARVTVIHSDDSGDLVAWSFETHKVDLRSESTLAAYLGATLDRDLERTYLTKNDATGAIVAFLNAPGASDLGGGYVRALAGALEVCKPTGARPLDRTWTAIEPDTDGHRSSSYTLDFWLDSPLTIPTARFSRTSVSIDPPQADDMVEHVVTRSSDHGLIRADGVVSHAIVVKRRAVRVGSHRLGSLLSTTVATLVAIEDVGDAPESPQIAREITRAPGLDVQPSRDVLRARAFRQAAKNVRFETVLARAEAATNGDANLSALAHALAAQFFVRPATVERARPLLARASAGSPLFAALKLALEEIGTPPCRRVLAQTMIARARDPAAEQLASALARVTRPDLAGIAALHELARANPASEPAVLLALGTAASMLVKSDPPLAERVASDLASRLGIARDDAERRTLLLALGNAGNVRTLAAILAYERAPNPSLRAAAATALRGMRTDAASDARTVLLQDADAYVRLNAATAADDTPKPAEFAAIANAAAHDVNEDVRLAAIAALARASKTEPGVRAILTTAARHDPDSKVRAEAAMDRTNIDDIAAADRL